jgi:predicted metal-binding protein
MPAMQRFEVAGRQSASRQGPSAAPDSECLPPKEPSTLSAGLLVPMAGGPTLDCQRRCPGLPGPTRHGCRAICLYMQDCCNRLKGATRPAITAVTAGIGRTSDECDPNPRSAAVHRCWRCGQPGWAAMSSAVLYVCTACRRSGRGGADSGEALYDRLTAGYGPWARRHGAEILPVACLDACGQPCAVAFAGPGRYSYVFGQLRSGHDVETLIEGFGRYIAAPAGCLPDRQRPAALKRGVLAGIPPLERAP